MTAKTHEKHHRHCMVGRRLIQHSQLPPKAPPCMHHHEHPWPTLNGSPKKSKKCQERCDAVSFKDHKLCDAVASCLATARLTQWKGKSFVPPCSRLGKGQVLKNLKMKHWTGNFSEQSAVRKLRLQRLMMSKKDINSCSSELAWLNQWNSSEW